MRPRLGFGTALVPLSRPHLFPESYLAGPYSLLSRQPRSLRGLYGCRSRHFCINASSSALFPSGSMIRVVTYRSPAPPAFGRPLPFRRNVRPLEVFFGIDRSTGLPTVGTRTLPPSTAS